MWLFTVIRTLTAITRALQSICNCLACCVVITHLTMYTHYPSSTIILSIIQIQSSTWTTSVVIILCVCVSPPLMTDTDGLGCFACPEGENIFAEGLSLVILLCGLLTGHWSIPSITSLDLCYLSPEVIAASLSFGSLLSVTRDLAIVSFEIASLLKGTSPAFAKLLHTVVDWKAPYLVPASSLLRFNQSGQTLLQDARSKISPLLSSDLSVACKHQHPVFAVGV